MATTDTAEVMKPAEVFSPGIHIAEELEGRGWSREHFASLIGETVKRVDDVITARWCIDAELAEKIGAAFGTGPEIWLNLEATYTDSLVDYPKLLKAARELLALPGDYSDPKGEFVAMCKLGQAAGVLRIETTED